MFFFQFSIYVNLDLRQYRADMAKVRPSNLFLRPLELLKFGNVTYLG